MCSQERGGTALRGWRSQDVLRLEEPKQAAPPPHRYLHTGSLLWSHGPPPPTTLERQMKLFNWNAPSLALH